MTTHGELLYNAYRDTVGFKLQRLPWCELALGIRELWERMANLYDVSCPQSQARRAVTSGEVQL